MPATFCNRQNVAAHVARLFNNSKLSTGTAASQHAAGDPWSGDARKTESHAMTPDELHQRLLALFGPDATSHKTAAALRVHERSVRKWLSGDRKVPGPVIAYLDLKQKETVK